MRKINLILVCWLLLLSLCFADSAGQRRVHYPKNADDITAFVEVFSQINFSVNDASKYLGVVNKANHDDGFYPGDFSILLTPFPSDQGEIKRVVLDKGVDGRKLDAVQIDYLKPVSISYGELREKYGAPGYLKPPAALCARHAVNCPPAFVGYSFSFMPDRESLATGKRLEVAINLEMEWSKEVPHHSDKDFLVVKAIRFKRIWRDQED